MKNLISQINVGEISGPGAIGSPGSGAPKIFSRFISGTIGVLTIVAAIWFLFQIITGGIDIINSSGDKQKVADAKGKITNGIIGLVVVIAAIFIVGLVGTILGFGDILDPLSLIDQVAI